jgi:hypothetical protein
MAAPNVTTTTLADQKYADIIDTAILEQLRAEFVCVGLVKNYDISGDESLSRKISQWPTLTATAPGELTDITTGTCTLTHIHLTAAEVGLGVEISDLSLNSTIMRDIEPFARQCALAIRDKIEVDICALLAGFGSTAGNTTTDLSIANYLTAIATLEAANAPKPYVAVWHPTAVGHLRTALSTATGTTFGNVSPEDVGVKGGGYAFHMYGVDNYESSNVTNNTNTYFSNGMFSKNYALGMVTKMNIKTELQRDASKRTTEAIVVSTYGVGEIEDSAGVWCKSDV